MSKRPSSWWAAQRSTIKLPAQDVRFCFCTVSSALQKNWRQNIRFLSRNASVYAVDLFNMGKSERVPGLDAGLEAHRRSAGCLHGRPRSRGSRHRRPFSWWRRGHDVCRAPSRSRPQPDPLRSGKPVLQPRPSARPLLPKRVSVSGSPRQIPFLPRILKATALGKMYWRSLASLPRSA